MLLRRQRTYYSRWWVCNWPLGQAMHSLASFFYGCVACPWWRSFSPAHRRPEPGMKPKGPALLAKPERSANWQECFDFALRPGFAAHARLSAEASMPERRSTKRGSAPLFQRNTKGKSKELWPESYPDPKRPAAGFNPNSTPLRCGRKEARHILKLKFFTFVAGHGRG